MTHRLTRRTFTLSAAAALLTPHSRIAAQEASWQWQYPIGRPGDVPGNGFRIGHGFATQNTWFYPDGWHTGEDYYAIDGETAEAEVYAVADGEIVYAGFDYPGPVVIVRHEDDLFSMYGHLDYELAVREGPVAGGDLLGTVLDRTDGRAPSHLHFEIRRFLTTPEVNGASPRYGFTCGPDCPPGPGYWPIGAPEHPVAMGWLNPVHVIMRRALPGGIPDGGAEVMVADGVGETAPFYASPDAPDPAGELALEPGARFALTGIDVGAEDTAGTSAEAYRVWYQVRIPDFDEPSWIRAVVPTDEETGADGRPSSLRFVLLPVIVTPS